MKKVSTATINFIVDGMAFASLIFLLSTGFLIYFILPPGQGGASVWGLTRHEWGDIHFILSLLFVATMVIHVILHWSWIDGRVRGRQHQKRGLRYGIAAIVLACILLIALVPYVGPRGQDTGNGNRQGHAGKHDLLKPGQGGGVSALDGAMTLGDIEKTTGIPVSYFAHRLGLPSCVSPGESLHHLKEIYGFRNKDLKKLIRAYRE